jgi:hypothetical protein
VVLCDINTLVNHHVFQVRRHASSLIELGCVNLCRIVEHSDFGSDISRLCKQRADASNADLAIAFVLTTVGKVPSR